MRNLLLELKGPNGNLKSWRLRAQAQRPGQHHVFGSSKHADLRSPDTSVRGVQGLIVWDGKNWLYNNLELDPQHLDVQTDLHVAIDATRKILFGNGLYLQLTPYQEREKLFQNVANLQQVPQVADVDLASATHQLFVLVAKGHVLETKLLLITQNYSPAVNGDHGKIATTPCTDWQHSEYGPYEIYQRSVKPDQKLLKALSKNPVVAQEGRGPVYATLGGAMILGILMAFAPSTQNAGEAARRTQAPLAYREIKLAPPQKLKPQAAASARSAVADNLPASSAPEGHTRTQTIKSLISASRLSSLIGKISAGAAKSSNIVITNGVAAGSAPTGRALASLGKEHAGQDWGAEGKGNAVQVGTLGVAGGHGVNGLSNLSAGKTGSGGAQLLEDESEIIGGLDREVIAQYIRTQIGQILYCYERQLSATPELYGKVAVRFTIGSKGNVETQRIGDSTLRNAAVEGCILQKVAKWKFPAPEGGTKVNVTYPFLFKSTN